MQRYCFRCGAPADRCVMCWTAGLTWPINVPIYFCEKAPNCPFTFLDKWQQYENN